MFAYDVTGDLDKVDLSKFDAVYTDGHQTDLVLPVAQAASALEETPASPALHAPLVLAARAPMAARAATPHQQDGERQCKHAGAPSHQQPERLLQVSPFVPKESSTYADEKQMGGCRRSLAAVRRTRTRGGADECARAVLCAARILALSHEVIKHLLDMKKRFSTFTEPQKLTNYVALSFSDQDIEKSTNKN